MCSSASRRRSAKRLSPPSVWIKWAYSGALLPTLPPILLSHALTSSSGTGVSSGSSRQSLGTLVGSTPMCMTDSTGSSGIEDCLHLPSSFCQPVKDWRARRHLPAEFAGACSGAISNGQRRWLYSDLTVYSATTAARDSGAGGHIPYSTRAT